MVEEELKQAPNKGWAGAPTVMGFDTATSKA
jgi:hypothetical protein